MSYRREGMTTPRQLLYEKAAVPASQTVGHNPCLCLCSGIIQHERKGYCCSFAAVLVVQQQHQLHQQQQQQQQQQHQQQQHFEPHDAVFACSTRYERACKPSLRERRTRTHFFLIITPEYYVSLLLSILPTSYRIVTRRRFYPRQTSGQAVPW